MVEHGYEQFLHHMEPDPDGAWRLHIFATDEPAMSILADMAVDRSNPSQRTDPTLTTNMQSTLRYVTI